MIIVDVETTGVDSNVHSIVSIGAVDFFNPKNYFYKECRPFPGAEIDESALNINGFTQDQLYQNERPTLEEAIIEFHDWLANVNFKTLAGENPSFDRDFVKSAAKRYGISLPFNNRTVDLHSISYASMLSKGFVTPLKPEGVSDLSADKTFQYVGLPAEPRPHIAIVGAKMEAEALSRLIFAKPLLNEFLMYEVPDYLR